MTADLSESVGAGLALPESVPSKVECSISNSSQAKRTWTVFCMSVSCALADPSMVRQVIRYGVVGVVSNAILYGAYLVLAHTVMEPHGAMTLTYCAGVLLGFFVNRSVTFRHEGVVGMPLVRYVVAYIFGYLVNLAALGVFVDMWHFPHEYVQAAVVVSLPVILFSLQKWWVFPAKTSLN